MEQRMHHYHHWRRRQSSSVVLKTVALSNKIKIHFNSKLFFKHKKARVLPLKLDTENDRAKKKNGATKTILYVIAKLPN